ncbi:MAG: YbaN family protein [Proteobacteria bacterium]|nr:YbaN family protein [Pseudomonadota bacterium]
MDERETIIEEYVPPNRARKHSSKYVRVLLVIIGTVALALGVIGIILPLLPTTPFLLLATACYARSSDRFYNGLMSNRFFGPPIREWRDYRSVTKKTKTTSIIIVIISFGMTIGFVLVTPLPRIILSVVALGIIIILLLLPSRRRETH